MFYNKSRIKVYKNMKSYENPQKTMTMNLLITIFVNGLLKLLISP